MVISIKLLILLLFFKHVSFLHPLHSLLLCLLLPPALSSSSHILSVFMSLRPSILKENSTPISYTHTLMFCNKSSFFFSNQFLSSHCHQSFVWVCLTNRIPKLFGLLVSFDLFWLSHLSISKLFFLTIFTNIA